MIIYKGNIDHLIVKIKGTRSELQASGEWFLTHTNFQPYVKHVEIWVPLFDDIPDSRSWALPGASPLSNHDGHALPRPYIPYPDRVTPHPIRCCSRVPDKVTLEEIYGCVKILFPDACVLSIEGGHCKNSEKIKNFRKNLLEPIPSGPSGDPKIITESIIPPLTHRYPQHPKIKTLILKGSWNIIRSCDDFHHLAASLPRIREWHCVYSKPKTEAYKAICLVLRSFPQTITRVNICLEGLNGKQPSSLGKWRKLRPDFHICNDLGRILPQLESLSYTGHICSCFFKTANAAATKSPTKPRLKSIDLFVRNVCRDTTGIDDGPSIYNWPFIQAFELLMLEAIPSLDLYPELKYVRIRFLDLDSPRPLLNPYWLYENNTSCGLWSQKIDTALNATARKPKLNPIDRENDFAFKTGIHDGSVRPKNLCVGEYENIARIW